MERHDGRGAPTPGPSEPRGLRGVRAEHAPASSPLAAAAAAEPVGADALVRERDALRAELEALAEEARALRTVIDMLPVGIWFTDETGRIVFGNPAGLHIWEGARYVEPDAFHEYRAWWEDTGEPLTAESWALARAVKKGETSLGERIVIECFDGTRKTILNSAFPVRDAAGRIRGGVVMNEDVTARRRAEREREDALAHLGFHLENTPIGIVEWSADFRVTSWNPSAERIFGWSAAEVIGRRMSDLRWVHDEDAAGVAAIAADMMSGARPRNVSVNRNYRKDGATIHCEWYNSARFDAAGHLVSVHSQVVDVTARTRAEEALRAESARKDTFIATLGHELRNPLTPIRAGFELLRRDDGDPAQRREAAEVVDRQLRHLARLVDDLLDVSRVTRGNVELRRRPVDLARVVREALADHRALFVRGGIAVEERLPAAPVALDGDPLRLAQALGNVLQNAAKYTPPGGHVCVALEVGDGAAAVCVRDDGDGIAPETLARLFQPFEQGERPGRAGSASGSSWRAASSSCTAAS